MKRDRTEDAIEPPRLRVLILSSVYPDAERPAAGNFIELQARALARQPGVQVAIVAPLPWRPYPLSLARPYRRHRGLPHRETWNGLEVFRPRFIALPRMPNLRPWAIARAALPLLQELKRHFAFDVIAAQFFWPDGPAVAQLAKALGVPFSIKARGPDVEHAVRSPRAHAMIRQAAQEAGGLLAVSEATKARLIELGLAGRGVEVHYTGVDRNLFRPVDVSTAKAELGLQGPVLLSVGNLTARKRQSLILDALAALPVGTLLLAGSGPEAARLQARARNHGLDDRVRFLGTVPHGELPGLYAAADVTVHAAVSEGLANAWVESLACGTPVVAVEAGGARELLRAPGAGMVVAPSSEAIAAAIRAILESPRPRKTVAASVGHLSWERNGNQLAQHLRALTFAAAR